MKYWEKFWFGGCVNSQKIDGPLSAVYYAVSGAGWWWTMKWGEG